jgi:hypothetical protein
MTYIDYSRYKNYKKINIDYTLSDNNTLITSGPVFNAAKIIETKVDPAYTNFQENFENESLRKTRLLKEYNKIR